MKHHVTYVQRKNKSVKNVECKHSLVLFLIFFYTVLEVFFCIHVCSLIWWHLQSDAFALQLVWCSSFLHLLHAGSLQLAWLPQFAQYKFSCSHMPNQKLFESYVWIFVLKIDFLTYIVTSYWHIRYRYSQTMSNQFHNFSNQSIKALTQITTIQCDVKINIWKHAMLGISKKVHSEFSRD